MISAGIRETVDFFPTHGAIPWMLGIGLIKSRVTIARIEDLFILENETFIWLKIGFNEGVRSLGTYFYVSHEQLEFEMKSAWKYDTINLYTYKVLLGTYS